MSDDVNYVYVKGQGWVPRGPEPEPEPDPYLKDWAGYDFVKYREELRRQAERYWGAANVTTVNAAPHYRLAVQTHDEIWYYDDPVTFTRQEPPRQIPRGEPREPNRVRYYPGSNTPAETMSVEESPRDRQIREYRERLRKRGRNP